MPRETRKPSEPTDPYVKSSRRKFLTGVVIALGASALTQPDGGVIGVANASPPKKDGGKIKQQDKIKQQEVKSHKKKKGGKKNK